MVIRINKDQRGLLFQHGDYIGLLKPGKYYFYSKLFGYDCTILNIAEPFITNKSLNLFLQDPAIAQELIVVDIMDQQIALHFEDDKIVRVLQPGKHAVWKGFKKHDFLIIDKSEPAVSSNINLSIFNHPVLANYYFAYEVQNYEAGLLTYNGVLKEILKPGKYYFWNNSPVAVKLYLVDLRQQQLEVNGQELMTEDKVTLRLNFVCQYKIVDPKKVIMELKDYQNQIYILLQLILREYIGNLKLDEVLQKKEEITATVLDKLKEKSANLGIEFLSAGLKDIILPGEIKDILNTVLIAEKKAQANIITRREEIASTRSLLNTAKLMEENPTLYRLKELEYLEKISEKISNIQLSNSGNVLEQLSGLIGIKKPGN